MYTSTRYIHPTTHKHDFELMGGGGRYRIQSPNVSNLSAHVAHFTSADYRQAVRGVIPVHKEMRERASCIWSWA